MEAGALRKTVIGTPYYLAPEVLKDAGYDFKADIWAVGISAIEMAEKDPPYADLHPMRVLFVLANNPSPKLTHEEHWSPEFNSFIKSCLEINPEKRPFAKELLTHVFLRKSNPAKLEPLLQSAEDAIFKHGGIEKALEAMKPKPEEDETEQDAADKDLNEDMLAGSGALLTLDSPGSTAGTSLAIGSSDDEGTDSFFDDFTSEEEDEDELDIDDLLAGLGDEESSAKVKKAAAPSSANSSAPSSSRNSTSAASNPKLASVTAVVPSIPIVTPIGVQLDIAGIVDARKVGHDSNPNTPHKSSRTPRTRREEANKLKIQMAANGQIFGAPAPVMTARGATIPAVEASPAKESAPAVSDVQVEIDWIGLENDAKEEAEQEAKKKLEKEAAQAGAAQAAADVSAARPEEKAAATIDWTKQMQEVQDEIKAARTTDKTKTLRLPPGVSTSTGSSDSITSPTPRTGSSGSFDDLLAELDILRSGTPDKNGRPVSLSRLIARAFDREFPGSKPSNIRGEWLGRTVPSANGSAPHPFRNNPQFVLTIAEPTQVLVTVKQLKSSKVGESDSDKASQPAALSAATDASSSGSTTHPISVHIFRVRNISHAFNELPAYGAVIESELSRDREAGNAGLLEEADDVKYVIVPIVHDLPRGEKVEFELEVRCANKNANAKLVSVPTLDSKWIRGAWTDRTAGGSATYPSWRQNPQFLLRVQKQSDVHLYLTQNMTNSQIEHLGWYIVRSDDGRHIMRLSQTRLMNNDLKFRKRMEISSGRLSLTPGSYIIIPCTYEPGKLGNFTLTALSSNAVNLDFDLVEAPYSRAFNSKWALDSAGGCMNHATWLKNPKFSIVVPRASQLTFVLSTPPSAHATTASGLTTPRSARGAGPGSLTSSLQLAVPPLAAIQEDPFIGFYLFKGAKINAARLSRKDLVGRTKHFTDAREVVEGIRLDGGSYILVPCTYLPNVFTSFNLQIHADNELEHVAPIEEASISLDGEWKAPNVTAGGNFSHPTWRLNPQYVITTKSEAPVVVTLEQASKANVDELPFISVAVIRPTAATVHASETPTGSESSAPAENAPVKVGKKLFHIRPIEVVHLSHFSNIVRQNSIPILVTPNNPLILLPMTMTPNMETSFKIAVNSKDVFLERLADELFVKVVPGEWSVQSNTVGGCINNRDTWLNNPKYRFATKKPGLLRFVLQQSSSNGIEHSSSLGALQAAATSSSAASSAANASPLAPGGFYVFRCPNPQVPSFTRQDFVGKSEFSSNKEVRAQFELEVGVYCIVLTKFEPLKEGKFALHLFAPHPEFAIGSMK